MPTQAEYNRRGQKAAETKRKNKLAAEQAAKGTPAKKAVAPKKTTPAKAVKAAPVAEPVKKQETFVRKSSGCGGFW